MDACYQEIDGEPIIILQVRDSEGRKHQLKINSPFAPDKNFRPYMYAPMSHKLKFSTRHNVTEVETGHETIFGEECCKVFTRLPRHVGEYKNEKTMEDNIPFPYRFLIDKNIYVGIEWNLNSEYLYPQDVKPCEEVGAEPRVLYWDIEVESPPEIMALPDNPEYPIVAVSTSIDGERRVFQISEQYNDTEQFKTFDTERELLESFIEYVNQKDIDALAGYNSKHYDEPYLFKRCDIVGVNKNKISPVGEVRTRRVRNTIEIDGTQVPVEAFYEILGVMQIDLFDEYKSMILAQGEEESWDLKSVAAKAGFYYEDYGDKVKEMHGTKKLAEYALNDAIANEKISEEFDLVKLYDRLRRVAGCPIEMAHINSKVIDYLCLRTAEKALKKPEKSIFKELAGAYVAEPAPGLHENVAVFDLSAMYPTILITFNLSPEKKFVQKKNTNDVLEAISFSKDEPGLFPKVVKPLMEERDRLRDVDTEVANLHEWAIKFLVCAVYGVFAYEGFRLHDPDCANSITAHGRNIITELSEKTEDKWDTKVLYSDTDSLFIKVQEEQTKQLSKMLKKIIKDYCEKRGATTSVMDIDMDLYADKLFFKMRKERGEWVPTKKKYAYFADGKIKMKGFAPRKVSNASVTKVTIMKFFRKLFLKGEKEAVDFLQEQRYNFRSMDPFDIAIPRGVNKPFSEYKRADPWADGLKFMCDNFGVQRREDWKARLLYTKSVDGFRGQDRVAVYDWIPDEVHIDYEKMREKTLDQKFEGIIKALGKDPELVLRPPEQKSITSWIP